METVSRIIVGALVLALTGCNSQPSVQRDNATTDAQLTAVNAQLSEQDGSKDLRPLAIATPTVGQRMNAEPQPPKKQ